MKKSIVLATAVAFTSAANVAMARGTVEVVGSSTVYPFATVVAEKVTKAGNPVKIESTGSGGGLKLFCKGIGEATPDFTNASRRIKSSEVDKCKKAGINDIVEVRVGYDGIVVANAKNGPKFDLTKKDLALAIAKQIPGPDGKKLIDNPHQKWSDVRKGLPNVDIVVYGPPPSSGTRDAFVELALEGGFKKFADWKELRKIKGTSIEACQRNYNRDAFGSKLVELGLPTSLCEKKGKVSKGKNAFKKVAHAIREDGKYIEMGENDNAIIGKLVNNPNAVGVFGFSFLDQNMDKIKGAPVDGTAPTFEGIADSSYPISRPLQFYVKKAHVGQINGMKEYLAEFTSEAAFGEGGYLSDKGLIPMPKAERECNRAAAMNLTPMAGYDYACGK